jgi:hypothetical protein
MGKTCRILADNHKESGHLEDEEENGKDKTELEFLIEKPRRSALY